MKKKSKRNAILFEGIPPITRARFKAACARRGVTMKEAITDLMGVYASAGFPAVITPAAFEKLDYER